MYYFPILRHSDSEMNAFKSLQTKSKEVILPVIEGKRIPKNNAKKWDKTLNSCGKYLQERIGNNPFIYDFRNIFDNLQDHSTELKINGLNPVQFVLTKFQERSLNFIPCINHDSPDWLINNIVNESPQKIAIRIRYFDIPSTLHDLINNHVESIIEKFNASETFIILDFKNSINTEQIKKATEYHATRKRKIILAMTTLDTTKDVETMSFKRVSSRNEMLIYNKIKQQFPDILYSDYTTRLTPEPDLKSGFNMNNSYLKIYYTTKDGYYLGKSFKFDEGEPENFQLVCDLIVNSKVYLGETFSEGDRVIKSCSLKKVDILTHKKTIELSINHHLEFIAKNFFL